MIWVSKLFLFGMVWSGMAAGHSLGVGSVVKIYFGSMASIGIIFFREAAS